VLAWHDCVGDLYVCIVGSVKLTSKLYIEYRSLLVVDQQSSSRSTRDYDVSYLILICFVDINNVYDGIVIFFPLQR